MKNQTRKHWKKLPLLALPLVFVQSVQAHCPLCTLGAGAAAGGAAMLGVGQSAIGVLIGGFAVSMGYWVSRWIKKKYIPFQKSLLILISYVTTIVPLLMMMTDAYPLWVSITGNYGTWLNTTYVINEFFVGSILGGILVFIAPDLSKWLTKKRGGKMFPYQGTLITVLSLIISGTILQFIF